jgi:hypothetical protein
MRTPSEASGSGRRRLCVSSGERVATEEAVQLLHFAGGIVGLVERFEPRQLRLDEARERCVTDALKGAKMNNKPQVIGLVHTMIILLTT